MNDNWFLIYYIEVLIICSLIIIHFYRNREKIWYSKSIFYKLVNLLSWIVLIVLTALTYLHFTLSQSQIEQLFDSSTFLGKSTGILLYILFLSASTGIIAGGIKSIIEKKSVFPGPSILLRIKVTGSSAVISGIIYIIIGSMFLFGVLSVGRVLLFSSN